VKRTAKWVEKNGVKPGCMFTDSPYYGSLAGHRHLLVVAAHRNCSRHVTLELEGGKTMLVDDSHPVTQERTR
jgi:hypothetical protein